jgi:hypothetical protein
MKLHPQVSLALVAFTIMCFAVAAACVEWIRMPVEKDCGSIRTTVLQ